MWCNIEISICQQEAPKFNISEDERIKLLVCTEIVNRKFQSDASAIEALFHAYGDRESVSNKVTADILLQCYHRVKPEHYTGV